MFCGHASFQITLHPKPCPPGHGGGRGRGQQRVDLAHELGGAAAAVLTAAALQGVVAGRVDVAARRLLQLVHAAGRAGDVWWDRRCR